MAVRTSGLRNFSNKLERYANVFSTNWEDKVANQIADVGVLLAEDEYNKTDIGGVKVYKEPVDNGLVKVIADSTAVAYIEFGTGEYARGTYKGELPTQMIEFESGGKQQSTQGWEYYYPNPKTKITKNGQRGWMISKGNFTVGKPAGNQMYYTSQNLKERVRDIIRKNIKGDANV